MNKTEGVIAGVIVIILIALALAVNILVMPYLLMIALGALGYHFPFIICMVFWAVVTALFNKLRPKQVNHNK